MKEIWKKINGYDSYRVSNLGRIKSLIGKEKILKNQKNPGGYLSVRLNGKRHLVHRLVGFAFIKNPENKPEINHKNKIKTDNCVKNLEWNTRYENEAHKYGKPNMELFSKLVKTEIESLVPLKKLLTK